MVWYLSELRDHPQAFFVYFAATIVAILTGLVFHEFTHAWTANELGDDTARRRGRMTLNPLVHLDPVWTAAIFLFGFGMAKPTPVQPYRLKYGPLRGNAIVAFAGPLSNFVFAGLAAIPIQMGLVESRFATNVEAVIRFGTGEEYVFLFLYFVIWLNVLLGLFNLIPIPPLDGFKVVVGFLPAGIARELIRLEPYGFGILMTMFVVGFFTGFNPIWFLIGGLADSLFTLLV
ncbi:MAG: site-2 protease family protein [Chloroflexi bacterium]|nr:site-2 protease family protein [Chloroflexota bacterium]